MLRIDTEWEDPRRAKGAELRATWCSLGIAVGVGDEPRMATRHYDHHMNTVRNRIFGPAYPIAEWLALNWFSLLHTRRRTATGLMDLRAGSEGMDLPCIRLSPEGSEICIAWTAYVHSGARVDFLDSGSCVLPRHEVESGLSGFIDRVVARLEEKEIEGTVLQEEWEALLRLSPDERQFCVAAANLGLDPFALPEEVEAEILGAAELLDAPVLEDFYLAASAEGLLRQARSIAGAIENLQQAQHGNPDIVRLRDAVNRTSPGGRSWSTGYHAAELAREELGLAEKGISLEFLQDLVAPHLIEELDDLRHLDGVVVSNCNTGATGVARSFGAKHVAGRKFRLARFLCERLTLPPSSASLVTGEKSTRQKINRAFAAQLLAPADSLRRRVDQRGISREEIEEIAEEFEVSALVIEHQIENHRLADTIE